MGLGRSDDPNAYIRKVHHLIEQCMLFNMSREECAEALLNHANIKPVITTTVWNELRKENGEFFEAYERNREDAISNSRERRSVCRPKRIHTSIPVDHSQGVGNSF